MNNISNHIKKIGIVFSYIWMLFACYFSDWNPFVVFMSYLIEVVVLLFIYAILRFTDEKKNPRRYRKSQSIINLFIGIVPMVIFQYFIIGWTSLSINPEQSFIENNLFFSKEVLYVIVSIVIFYSVKAFQITIRQERLGYFQENFLFQVMALTVTNTAGFIAVLVIGFKSLLFVLIIMVVFRIILEFYFSSKMKFI